MKKTTRLTIETERVLVIRRRKAARRAKCGACGEVVNFVTVEEGAALTRISARAIYRRVEAGSVHFTESADGALVVCLNSLRD
jgi:ribosomal protein L34E